MKNFDFSNKTLKSVRKDVAIIKYFVNQREKDINQLRQRSVIDHFKDTMSKGCVISHLHKLLSDGILVNDSMFPGTYTLNASAYIDYGEQLIESCLRLLGEDIKDLITSKYSYGRVF